MKRLSLLLFFALLFTACAPTTGSTESAAPQATRAPAVVATAIQATVPVPEVITTEATVAIEAANNQATPVGEAPAAEAAPPVAQPSVTEPAPPAVALATETPTTTIVSGRTAEGAFFYGSPDATVTLIDYSDFL